MNKAIVVKQKSLGLVGIVKSKNKSIGIKTKNVNKAENVVIHKQLDK